MSLDCPHCDTAKVQFLVAFNIHPPVVEPIYHALALCGHCHKPVAMTFLMIGTGAEPHNFAGDLTKAKHIRLGSMWPRSDKKKGPADTPEKVAAAYDEASESLKRGNWNSAGMMFRRALELATLQLDRGLAGKKLAARIDALAEANKVTPSMKEWAHIVRLDGNAAVHEEEEIDENTANGLQSFTETFLIYAFTLPAMVKARKPADTAGAA